MKLNLIFVGILYLTASFVRADEFLPSQAKIEKINCIMQKDLIIFDMISIPYTPYEENLKNIKLTECQRIQIGQQIFFTALFESLQEQEFGSSKALIFEIALFNEKEKKLNTVRSEIIDRLKLQSDLPDYNFENSLKVNWGHSKKDHKLMLRFEIAAKTLNRKKGAKVEAPHSYLIKLNKKDSWFEDVF